MILLNNLSFNSAEERAYARSFLSNLKNATSPIELTFKFAPLTRKAEIKLARYVAQGNFPNISRIHLELNTDVEQAGLCLMTGNDKLVLKPGTTSDIASFTNNCGFLQVFSSQPMRCKIDASSLQNNDAASTSSMSLNDANFVSDQRIVSHEEEEAKQAVRNVSALTQ